MLRTGFALLMVLAIYNPPCTAQSPQPLPRSTPESQGVSSQAVLHFIDAADREANSLHSFMLLRHGHVIAEGWWTPYNAESRHELYSLSKSFTSTAVGLAVAEGKVNIDDTVANFFPDDVPPDASTNLKAMRVRDLLTMSTGHTSEARLGPSTIWTKAFLAQPVVHQPGTHFLYNTPATYMLSAIVQKQTGQTTLDYLKPRLFDPLGIVEPTWGTSPQGISLGGYGLSVRTEDIAKFGQLYLQKGMWNGKQLIPAEWIDAATSKQVSNGEETSSDWTHGYGFQFWRCRHGHYRGDGAFGQYCVVMPKHDAVVAITAGTKDMQRVLNFIWDKLEPGFTTDALSANAEDVKQLQDRLANLTLPLVAPQEPITSAGYDKITYRFEANDQKIDGLSVNRNEAGNFVLSLKSGELTQSIECGSRSWIQQRSAFAAYPETPIAACGNWTAEDQFTAKICFYETPFCLTAVVQFRDDQATLDVESNVAFGPTKRSQLVGRRQ